MKVCSLIRLKKYITTHPQNMKNQSAIKKNQVQSITAMQSNIIRFRDEIEIPVDRKSHI